MYQYALADKEPINHHLSAIKENKGNFEEAVSKFLLLDILCRRLYHHIACRRIPADMKDCQARMSK